MFTSRALHIKYRGPTNVEHCRLLLNKQDTKMKKSNRVSNYTDLDWSSGRILMGQVSLSDYWQD